jgi:hypothetical protein
MPIRTVPNTEYSYHLVIHDEHGQERKESDGSLLSQKILQELSSKATTDVFIMSHGWRGDIPAAIGQYDAWTGSLMTATPDIEDMRNKRPSFQPLLIGWHWPSEPWGDEGTGAFNLTGCSPDPIAGLVDDYAKRLGDTPAIRNELETIIRAHVSVVEPQTLPLEVASAYQRLDMELGMGHGGESAPPGADRPEFDPEDVFQAARKADSEVSFGGFSIGDLLAPLRILSFWKMKDRARRFGESGGTHMLSSIRNATIGNDVRLHLMGHSFGCIVVSAAAAGPSGSSGGFTVHSLVLVQGAISLWAYCPDIPSANGSAGYFNRLLTENRVDGPIVTTQSEFDSAVGTFYPLAAGLKAQVAYGELPRFGAVGTYGIQGVDAAGWAMGESSENYRFENGRIYNLESSRYIRTGNPPSGAHSDIVHPQVAHVIWEAAKVDASSARATYTDVRSTTEFMKENENASLSIS